jgi:hypothetical protein
MRLHVISKSLLGERKGLLRLPNLAHVESLHRLGVAMGRVLAKNLFCRLDAY